MKYFYFIFIIVLAGCSLPNKRTNYYTDRWMYEKSYSQKVYESNQIANQRRQNNDNKFANMVPPGDPDEVVAVAYQFENYSGLTQEDQRRVAASDAYGSTNGVGIKVGQIYSGGPSNNNQTNNGNICEREPVNKQYGEFEPLYNALINN